MKDNVSSAKLKGTVLFTVVSVLMVLIVFLMGTLALAATASNRAYGNYQKEQTEYTARAVLDSVVQAINEDHTTNGIKYHMAASLTSQASNPITVTVDASDGLQATVSIANAGNRQVYSETQGTWVSGTVYELSTTIDRTMAGTTYRAYIVDEKLAGGGGGGGGGGAFVSLGGVSGKIGTGGFTAGGTEIGIGTDGQQDYYFDNGAVQMAPVYVKGNLTLGSQTTVYFNKVGDAANQKPQFFAVTGDLTLSNDFKIATDPQFKWPSSTVDYTEIPTLYVGGTIYQVQSKVLFNITDENTGAANTPVNIYCGNLITNDAARLSLTGDLYAFDPDATTKLYNQNPSTMLFNWVQNTVQLGTNVSNDPANGFGDLYSAGNVEIGNVDIEGVVRVAKDLTILCNDGKSYGFDQNVIVGGTLDLKDQGVQNYRLTIGGNLCADTLKVYGGKDAVPTVIEVAGTLDVNKLVYSGTGGKVEIRCDNIRIREYTYNENVTLKDRTNNVYVGPAGAAPAEQKPELYQPAAGDPDVAKKAGLGSDNIYPDRYLEGEVKKKIVTVPSATQYDNYPTSIAEFEQSIGTSLASIPTYVKENDDPNDPNDDNKALPDVITTHCKIDMDSSVNKDITFKPIGTQVVIVEELKMASPKNIYVDDSQGKVLFFITGYMELNGGDLVTLDYKSKFDNANNTNKLYIDEIQPSESSDLYPNVYIFADDVIEANNPGHPQDWETDKTKYAAYFRSNNSGTVVTAHVRAPELKFSMDNGMTGNDVVYQQKSTKLDSNNQPITIQREFSATETVGVIGQLICGNISVTNQWGMIYVTLPSNGCACCAACTGASGCTCQSNGCTCASCTCHGGGGGNTVVVPDKFATMYYNYF